MPGTSVSVACQNCATPPICAGSPLNFSLAVNNSFYSQASYFYKNYKYYSEISGPGFYKAGPMQATTTIYPHHSLFGVVKVDWNPQYIIYINNAYYTTTSSTTFSYTPQGDFTIRAELDMGYNWTFWDGANFCNITENSASAGSARAACNSNSYHHSSNFNTAIVSSTVAISGIVQGPVIDNIAGPLVVNAGSVNDYQLNTQGQVVRWTVNPTSLIQNNTQNSKILKLKAPNTSGTLTLNSETYNLQTCPTARSNTSANITVVNTPPATPILEGTRTGNINMKLKWQPVSDDNGSISQYKVYATGNVTLDGNDPIGAVFSSFVSVSPSQYSFSMAFPGESWRAARITAVDNEGLESAPSRILYYQADNVAPATPTNFAVAKLSNGLYQLSWTSVTDFSGIKKYDIWYNNQKWRTSLGSPYLFGKGELGSDLYHRFRVSAVDNLDNESTPTSPEVYFELDAKAPEIPNNVRSANMTNNSINILWDKSIDNSGTDPSYILRKYDATQTLLQTLPTPNLTLPLTGLNDNDKFSIRISALDINGNESAASLPINIVIDLTPPTQPVGLATTSGQNTIRRLGLTWQPSTDLNLKGYYIYKDGVQLNTIAVTSNTFTVTGVSDVYKSEYTVKAVDVNENLSVESNKLIVTPPVMVIDPVNIRVGIGVFNPEERLDVDENIQINDGNLIFSGTENNSRKIYPKQGGNIQIHTITTIAGHTILNTNSGNVGIGISNTPSEKLEVAGNIKSTGTLIGVALNVANVTVNDKISTNKLLAATLTVTGTLRSQNIYNESSIFTDGLQTQNLKSGLIEANNITGTVVGAINLSTTNLAADYSYTKNTFTESLTVLSGFTLLEPSSFPAALWKLEGTTLSYANQVHSKGDLRVGNDIWLTSNTMLGIHAIYTKGTLQLQNKANSGRVTIGTIANPQNYELEIGGGINAEGPLKATQVTAGFVTATNRLYLGYASFVYNLANTQIDLSNATLNINGLLKTQTLGISGDITAATLAGIGTRMVVADASGKLATQPFAVIPQTWNKSGNDINYTIGSVGIGTANIKAPLDVYSSTVARIYVRSPIGGAIIAVADGEWPHAINGSFSNDIVFGTNNEWVSAENKPLLGSLYINSSSTNGSIKFTTANDARNPRMEIKANGDVDINGLLKANSDLNVSGNVNITGVVVVNNKVDATEFHACLSPGSCPDFVFQKDYKLMDLGTLKTYITKNQHLPEIAAAKEMEATGMDIKQMNLMLLRKLEETTLYILEIEDRLKKLEKRR